MNITVNRKKVIRILIEVSRVILALTFIFSGFVKSVDPWGTALKIGEYLAAFNMEWLYSWRFGLAIWLTGAELMMGLMLLFSIRLRLISIFAAASMIFFTGLTLVLAIWNPVEDCGCFGEAIKFTNWESFIKNMILLPMSIAVLWGARKLPIMPTWRDGLFMVLFGTIGFGVGLYSYIHLPIIDFLPYKKGTDLVAAMNTSCSEDVETTVVYRNIDTGKKSEFTLDDTTWHDNTRWEYVETKTIAINNSVHPSVRDFAIFDNTGINVTEEVLGDEGVVYMIFASDLDDIKRRCAQKLDSAVEQAYQRGYKVMCITAEPLSSIPEVVLDTEMVPTYNMDATTIITVLRAKVGVVVFKDGVIIDKVNCRDMLDKGELPDYFKE